MLDDADSLLWTNVFQFPTDQNSTATPKPPLPESLVWARFASMPEGVHAIGCDRQRQKIVTKPNYRYSGFIDSTAEKIRTIETARGHGFSLIHHPAEGQYHVHVHYRIAAGAELQKNDKSELKDAIRKAFGGLTAHSCPS
jgi:hypothetical protein